MSKPNPKIEPMGLRRQQGCVRWLFVLVLLAVIASFVLASASYGF